MNAKFRNIKKFGQSILYVFLANHGTACAGNLCFPTVEKFLIESYGDNFREDENISVHLEKLGSKEFIVVTDKTSGTNYARNLLVEKSKDNFCLVLSTPPVAQLTASKVDANEFPKLVATDQAPPNLPGREITYVFNVNRFRYNATICKKISHYKKTVHIKTVSCSALLKQ